MIRKVTISLGIAVFVVIVIVGWQIGSCELANMELQDDIAGSRVTSRCPHRVCGAALR